MNTLYNLCREQKTKVMVTSQFEKSSEVRKDQQELIKGTFAPNDAKEIIDHIISKKINFHKLRIFGSEIKTGVSDDFSKRRIIELKESQNSLEEVIRNANAEGKSIRIESHISIEII